MEQVFVDRRGRRARIVTALAVLASMSLLAWLAVVGLSFTGGWSH